MALSSDQHVRHRPAPRISANDLARYMVASETGKLGIIRRAREAVTPPIIRYVEVRRVGRAYLADLTRNTRLINSAISEMERRADDPGLTAFVREDARLSVDALRHLLGMQNAACRVRVFRAATSTAEFIPVRSRGCREPRFAGDFSTQKSSEQIGGALFRLTKAVMKLMVLQLSGAKLACMLQLLPKCRCEKNLAGNRTPHHQLCLSIDVQCREVHVAPRTFVQRSQNLENACRFIAALWSGA